MKCAVLPSQMLLRYGLGDLENGTKWRWHHFTTTMRLPEPVLARYGGLLLNHLNQPESESPTFPVRSNSQPRDLTHTFPVIPSCPH